MRLFLYNVRILSHVLLLCSISACWVFRLSPGSVRSGKKYSVYSPFLWISRAVLAFASATEGVGNPLSTNVLILCIYTVIFSSGCLFDISAAIWNQHCYSLSMKRAINCASLPSHVNAASSDSNHSAMFSVGRQIRFVPGFYLLQINFLQKSFFPSETSKWTLLDLQLSQFLYFSLVPSLDMLQCWPLSFQQVFLLQFWACRNIVLYSSCFNLNEFFYFFEKDLLLSF